MDIYSPLCHYALPPGELLVLKDGRNRIIRCEQGKLLVTLQGCRTDFDLAPGMTLATGGNPLVLIESCSAARLSIGAADTASVPRRMVLGLALLSGLAGVMAASDSSPAATPGTAATSCLPNPDAVRIRAWRAGKGMLDGDDGPVVSNRVIAAHERKATDEACQP